MNTPQAKINGNGHGPNAADSAAAAALRQDWERNPRWRGINRPYSAEDVVRLRGTIRVDHTIARVTAAKLWDSLHRKPYVNALGALTGNQAMQQVKAGLDAIYLSGWQVAGDANLAGQQNIVAENGAPRQARLRADDVVFSDLAGMAHLHQSVDLGAAADTRLTHCGTVDVRQ